MLADVQIDWPSRRDEVSLFLSSEGLVVIAPLPEQRMRIVAIDEHAPEQPSREYVQALLDRRGPEQQKVRVHEVLWGSRFRIHHRVASTTQQGRVLLCGDAAHVHSPAGGQGMNTGIQDAISLAAVLGDPSAARLAAWASERHRVARNVVAMTDRMTRMATLRSPTGKRLRNAALGLISHLPPLQAAIAKSLAELDAR